MIEINCLHCDFYHYRNSRIANNDLYFSDSFVHNLLLSPISIAAGLAYGLVWGFIVKYVPERSDVSILILFVNIV